MALVMICVFDLVKCSEYIITTSLVVKHPTAVVSEDYDFTLKLKLSGSCSTIE